MATYEQKKQKVLDLIQRAKEQAIQNQQQSYTGLLDDLLQQLEAGRFMVVVCGEFRRGKSSLLNAFLNEADNLFPVDPGITTNLVTTITYGPEEKIIAHVSEADAPQERQITVTRKNIRQYVTEKDNPHNLCEARLLEIISPNEQLKHGLMMVDTPGIGGMYERHSHVTYEFIPHADAILFVSDALKPLSDIDLRFLKERIWPHTHDILFVLTKKDQSKDYRLIVEENRHKLSKALECPQKQITIVAVSNNAKLDAIESGDPEDLEESNFAELEKELWRFIDARRGRIQLARTLVPLGRILGEMRLPLQTEYDAYQQQDEQKRAEIERNLKVTSDYLQQLRSKNASWQVELHRGIEDMHLEAQRRLDHGFSELRHNLEVDLNSVQALDQRDLLLDDLQAQVNSLIQTLDRALNAGSAEIQGRLEALTGLAANPFDSQALISYAEASARGVDMHTFQFAKPANDAPMTQVIQVARNMSFVSNISHILSIALPGSWLVLGFLGWLLNSYEQKQKVREQELYQLKSYLQQQLIEGQRESNINLTKNMREIEQALQKDLLTRIQREQQSREQSLQSLQEARKLSASEAQARLQPLKAALARLKQLQVEIETVASSIVTATWESSDQTRTSTPPDQTRPTRDGKNSSDDNGKGWWADE